MGKGGGRGIWCILMVFLLTILLLWTGLFFLKEFEDTKGVIRIHKSKYRQHNGQKKKDKKRSRNYNAQKTKDQATLTPLTTGVELRCSGRIISSCSISDKCYSGYKAGDKCILA